MIGTAMVTIGLKIDHNEREGDEIMMRNTYLNGLQGKNMMDVRNERNNFGHGRKVNWNDLNTGKKDGLVQTAYHVDLFIQKDVKPVTSHKKLRPSRSIIKGRSVSVDVRMSNNLNQTNNAQQLPGYINSKNLLQQYGGNNEQNPDKTQNRLNNFMGTNNNVNPPPRSFSLDQKGDVRKNNLLNNYQEKDLSTNIQIITPNVNSIINNNYNNIYIQSPTDMDFKKLNHIYSPDNQNKIGLPSDPNMAPGLMNQRLASAGRKDNNPNLNNPNMNSYNYNPKSFISNTLGTGNQVKPDVQKMPTNNLLNSYDPKQIKVIDYSNNNTFVPQQRNSKIFLN